jgi:Tol biopolymer transport system component
MKHILLSLLLILLLTSCSAPLEPAPQEEVISTLPVVENTNPVAATQPPAATEEVVLPTETEPVVQAFWLAYAGPDSNIWLMDVQSGTKEAVTLNGSAQQAAAAGESSVRYSDPKWSSDGRYLAFAMQRMTILSDRADFQDSVMVYDTKTQEVRPVIENQFLAGFNWRPGTHEISFALSTDPNYFTGRGVVDAALAKGVQSINVESGEQQVIVAPQGYSLVLPRWSVDGRTVTFNEVYLMEGSGQFAFYDLDAQQYFSWGKPVGGYDLTPDGSLLAYDNLTYTPNGEERIFMANLQGGNEAIFSPTPLLENAYAFGPHFSPDGAYLAYLTSTAFNEPALYQLVVQPVGGGEARTLLENENISSVVWSPDGEWLAAAAGQYDVSQIVLVNFADGTSQALGEGWMPAWQPIQ